MNFKFATVALTATCLFIALNAQAATWFVRGDYAGTSTGTITAPFKTIQTAINGATNGDIIKVRGSNAFVYNENVNFNGKNLIVEAETAILPTIIGVGGASVVTMSGVSGSLRLDNARLEGFIIKNGTIGTSTNAPWGSAANFGGGVLLRYSLNCVLKRLTIDSCSAAYGGGVAVFQSENAVLEKLNIQRCSADAGGGICFQSNNLYNVSLSNILIRNCNATVWGGGMELSYSTNATMEYITIANCTASTAAAIERSNRSRFDAKNCIFANNLPNLTQFNWGGGWTTPASTITNSIVTASNDPNFAANNIDLTLTNSLDVNPQFVGANDYHLQSSSPAVDGGTLTAVTQDDLENNPRPINNLPDMGCYEMGVQHRYRLDSVAIHCGQTACTPVFLTAPVTNATGWTLEVDFDPTKVTPTTHTLGSMVTNGAMSAFVSNGKLILSIFLTGAANINGNAGDMLVCLGWANVGSVSNTVANLSGIVETSTVTSTTTTAINSRIAITGGNAVNFWVYYQGGSTAIPFSVAANPTQIYSGNQPNGMSYKGNVSNAGLYLLNLNTDSLVQFNRQSLSGRGAPVIGGFDGALVFKIIARDPAYQPTAAAIMASDVDGDGRITAADITYIQRRAVGIYPTGFPQFGTGMIVSNRHFPKAWLTSRPDYRLSTRYPVGDGVGCSRELVPKIDSLFTIDNFYRMRCDTAIMDISMLLLGDVDGNYLPTGGHQFGRQNVATMNYEICDNWNYNIRNNILYIKVYADKNLTGGDWIIENSALTLLGAEVVNANTTLLTTHLVGNNLSITASATSGDIPAGTPIFYLKVPASEQDRIKTLADLGTLTGYHNASIAEHVVRYCRVSTKEVDKNSIHFYPNPTADGLITIEHLDKTPDTIVVYNSLGQIIRHDIKPTGQTTPVDLSGFAKGVYHVKVDHQTYKVVKQ